MSIELTWVRSCKVCPLNLASGTCSHPETFDRKIEDNSIIPDWCALHNGQFTDVKIVNDSLLIERRINIYRHDDEAYKKKD